MAADNLTRNIVPPLGAVFIPSAPALARPARPRPTQGLGPTPGLEPLALGRRAQAAESADGAWQLLSGDQVGLRVRAGQFPWVALGMLHAAQKIVESQIGGNHA